MATALQKASHLKPEIRLSQAIKCFEAGLSREHQAAFYANRTTTESSPPDQMDVMRLLSEIDRTSGVVVGKRCFGPRFTNFLEAVQRFASIGDVVVGGSQNLAACGVWALVRLTVLSLASYSPYLDKLSSIFMAIGRSAPTQAALSLLYSQSKRLQTYLIEYHVVVVEFCHHIWVFMQKSAVGRIFSAISEPEVNRFQCDLDKWSKAINEEVDLLNGQEIADMKTLVKKGFGVVAQQRRLRKRLKILNLCSTYNFQTSWKQTRKLGNSSVISWCKEYKNWKSQEDSSTLVIRGKLGSGKSVLMANIVGDLLSMNEAKRAPVAYFFCRHDNLESLQARTILGSLSRQLLDSIKEFDLEKASSDDTVLQFDIDDLQRLLERAFPKDQLGYVILDGVDECDSTTVDNVIRQLHGLQEKMKIKLCISARIDPANHEILGLPSLNKASRIYMPDDNPDIEGYIRAELETRIESGKLKLGDPAVVLEIAEKLIEGSQGMFLWVALQLETLCTMRTDTAIRHALADLPRDLSETFSRILTKSGQGENNHQRRILELITAIFRPLTMEELREALSVITGDTDWRPSSMINDIASVLTCCGSVLAVDEEEQTVRFVHHSVKQFLLERWKPADNVQFTRESAQITVAGITLTYLNYGVFGTQISTTVVPRIEVDTASRHIISSVMTPSTKRDVTLKLLKLWKNPEIEKGKTMPIASYHKAPQSVDEFSFFEYSKSHCLAHFSSITAREPVLSGLLARLISRNRVPIDVTVEDSQELLWKGVEVGDDVLLRAILEIGKADVKAMERYGLPALSLAAMKGYEAIVKILLETGKLDVEAKDKYGQTPLLLAALNEYENVVKVLLETGRADVEAKDFDDQTSLSYAAEKGHEAMMKVLLEIGNADVEAKDSKGLTPLLQAATNGYEAIVTLLLETGGVNVEAKDINGQTSLSRAAKNGHDAVIKVLLEIGKADVDTKDNEGQTPLSYAAENGHDVVLKLLLETGRADVNTKNIYDQTPLLYAAKYGHEVVVKMLLETGKVDVNAKDKHGQTSLCWAAESGHEAAAKMLLETGEADVNDYKPMLWAAKNGHDAVVKVLLEIGKFDADAEDNDGPTPLSYAARYGHKDVVKMLLEIGKADVNAKDKDGETPLLWAARNGHKAVVKVLLEISDADIFAEDDIYGQTALSWATTNGHEAVVKLLEDAISLRPSSTDSRDLESSFHFSYPHPGLGRAISVSSLPISPSDLESSFHFSHPHPGSERAISPCSLSTSSSALESFLFSHPYPGSERAISPRPSSTHSSNC